MCLGMTTPCATAIDSWMSEVATALCREAAQYVVHKGYEDPKVIGALVDSSLQEGNRHEPTRCNRRRIKNLRHLNPCVSPDDHPPGGSNPSSVW